MARMDELEMNAIEREPEPETNGEARAKGTSNDSLNRIEVMPQKITPENEAKNGATKAESPEAARLRQEAEAEMVKIKKKVGIMILVSFFLITLGTTCGVLWPSLFSDIMKEELVLSPNSTSYKMWKETPIPMYLKIYLYNWTNHNEIGVKPPVKPHFAQMGPYVFREIDTKVNQQWNKNGTVTFQQKRVWHFQPELSRGSLTDTVTNLNPVAATIAYVFRDANSLTKMAINAALRNLEKIAITKSVKEILFDGYSDLLLKLAVELNYTKIPFEKFAWFYERNDSASYDGTFNMLTGSDSIYDLGAIKQWKFSDVSSYYPESCGPLKGTNGDLWPPVPNNKTVSVFSPDVCTTLSLKAAGKSEWLGLTGAKFISDADMFDNGTKVASRKCYCEGMECQPSGTLNVSSCKFGAPAFVSSPHFYLADESYRQNISGMNPKKEDHEFVLVVQPDTGIPMQVRAALQINFLVRPDKKLKYFSDLPEMYVPMLWFTQEVNLTEEYASQVKLLLILPPLGTGISFSVAAVGVLLVLISLFLYVRQRMRDSQNEHLLPKDSQSGDRDVDGNISNEE